MTELYLIRHAQAEGNLYRMMQGHWDGGVTAQGKAETEALGERFRDVHLDAVLSSDLYRARYTASGILAHQPGLSLQTDSRLREINVGEWQCVFFGDVMYHCPELISLFFNFNEEWSVSGAESFRAVGERGLEVLREFCLANDGKAAAVISHGITIKCMLSLLSGIPLSDSERLPICENTAVTKLVYNDGKFSIEYFNNRDHVPGFPRWDGHAPSFRAESFNPAENPGWYKACYASSWLSAHGSLKGYSADIYLDSALSHYRTDPRSVLQMYDGDKPVGLVDMDALRGAGTGAGWISLIYLEEEYRSKGWGIQLLGRAIMYYSSLGRKTLQLNVADSNLSARAFYEKWGFSVLRSSRYRLGSLLLMEKKLDDKEESV